MRPFVDEAGCESSRIRPAMRRNLIIPISERTETGEQTSRGWPGPQSIRQAGNVSKDSVVEFRPVAVGDEKRRLRHLSNAASIVAPDERCGRETLSRACPGAYARALANARERALSTYTLAARNQNPSSPKHSDD